MKDKRAKVVILAEKHGLMRQEGLWLTAGGRVVKPGWGEYASTGAHDISLLTVGELETGINYKIFCRRLARAVSKWKRREKILMKSRSGRL